MAIDLYCISEPLLRGIFTYWQSKRTNAGPPARQRLDPVVDIPRLVPHVFLVDTAPELPDFRIRLYGTALVEGFGEDRTGRRLADLSHIENHAEVVQGYWQLYESGAPVYTPRRTVSALQDFCAYSRLLLPLSADGRHVDMILGGIVFHRAGC